MPRRQDSIPFSRHQACQQRYLHVHDLAAAAERYWWTVRLPDDLQDMILAGIQVELERHHPRAQSEIAYARQRVRELE